MTTYTDPKLTQDCLQVRHVAHQGWFEVFVGDFLEIRMFAHVID